MAKRKKTSKRFTRFEENLMKFKSALLKIFRDSGFDRRYPMKVEYIKAGIRSMAAKKAAVTRARNRIKGRNGKI